jgi:prephenate dehydratase
MPPTHAAYLGPEGTFSHLVARRHLGPRVELVPLSSIYDVFAFALESPSHVGIVPSENSSGGTIYETIDCLVEHQNRVFIREELSLNVTLALIGRAGEKPRVIYSHFIPLRHSKTWLRAHYPRAEYREVSSTAKAVEAAAGDAHGAALAHRGVAARYGLDILRFPVHSKVPNITDFYQVSRLRKPAPKSTKTSLLVMLKNRPGSLYDFLGAFKGAHVNLTRLLSRPIVGERKSYLFVVDVEGTDKEPRVRRALAAARRAAERIQVLGVYPVRKMYAS